MNSSSFGSERFQLTSILLLLVLITPAALSAQTATISGKLIDRVCSVEDVYQLQPSTEKRCTLWMESSYSCPCVGCDGGMTTCKSVFTIYCPNKAVDNRPFNGAYEVCSDGSAMQIKHPTKTYIIQAFLRTVAQQLDGYGQFVGYQFQH